MRTLCAVLMSVFFCGSMTFAQVRITGFDRGGLLTWTNEICAEGSVYEVFRADSLTEPWEHLAWVTNQESLMLTGSVFAASTVFLKLGWVDHESLSFNYRLAGAFCQGEGLLNLRLVPRPAGTWMFASDFCELEGHPEGQGQFLFPWSTFRTNRLVLYVGEFGFDNKTWLDGMIEPVQGPRCSGLRYAGEVFRETFAGTGPIGTFIAETVP